MEKVLETERLYLRKLCESDFMALSSIIRDEETMYAYGGALSETEAREWLERQLKRYELYGFGAWAVILKSSGELIGQCGVTMQPWKGKEVPEIGYIFGRKYWHNGYATEAAAACKEYAFNTLNFGEVCSIIRDNNTPSERVALRLGMTKFDSAIKYYRGIVMPHNRFIIKK